MKKIKKILASLMVAVIVLTAAPLSGFVGLKLPGFGGLFSTKAEAATDPYYSKYGVTYNQLFRLYPSYLSPTGETVLLDRTVEAYIDVIDSYNSYDDFVGSFLFCLKEGVGLYSNLILESFGLTKSYEEKFRSNSIQSLMREIQSNSSVLSAVEEQVKDDFGKLKDSYTLTTTAGKLALIADLKEHCTMLTDSTIEEIANGVFENADDFMSDLGKVADLAEITISVVCLYAIETTLITDLRDSLDSDSVLKEDLNLLLNDLNSDPMSHILKYYFSDFMSDLYAKALGTAVANAAGSNVTFGSTIAVALVSTVFKFAADHLYIWALGDEIAQTIFLSTYSTDLDIAVTKMRTAFQRKTAKTDEDISEYELLYSSYLRSVKVTLESALIMAKTSADKDRVRQAIALINSFTYDDYIDFCMTQLKRDIDAGKVKRPASMNEGDESSTATQEESRVSIQEKFLQLKEAYPPNRGVTFFQSYGGAIQCFGFARFAFNKIFDCDMPASYKNEKRYEYVNNQNVVLLGQLSGAGAVTEANVKELLSQALVGDIIQACGASQHTMMVEKVTENSVRVYECNWDGDCCIYEREISFAKFAATYSQPHSVSESGVSLYRAANYDSLYWDGTAVFYDDSVNFVIENGVLVKYNGWQQYVLIPEEVTAIGDKAFYNNDRIIGVTMMDGVVSIGQEAFKDCDNLYFCQLSNSLETIGYGAFNSCNNLSSAHLPDTVTSLGGYAYYDCSSLSSVNLSSSLEAINYYVFSNCTSLTSINIPDSVTKIDIQAFDNCTSLKDVTLSKSLTEMGRQVFGFTAIESIEIPKSLDSCHVNYNYSYTFNGETYAIPQGPFAGCDKLKEVIFETGTTQVAQSLFSGCVGLEEIVIPDSVTVIESCAFKGCVRLSSVDISDSTTLIDYETFYDCVSLTKVVIPDSVTSIGTNAFNNCDSLIEVKIPDSVTSVQSNYYACYTFAYCDKLEKVTLSESITSVPDRMFIGCTALKTIRIPDAIESIGTEAFSGCTSLESFEYSENTKLKTIGNNAFYGCTSLKEAILPETLTSVGSCAFQNCTALEKVYIPQSTKTIGSQAFKGCEMLSDVTFADYSISEIPSQAFMDCPSLTEIVFPKGLKKIGSQAFVNDISLFNLTIPMSVTSIDSTAFSYPAKTTIFGVAGTYVETFANDGGFNFTDISAPCEGIILVDEVENVVLDVGQTFRAVFEFWPEEHTDIVTLTASNNKVTINGMDIYAMNTGDTVITATTSSGCTYEFNVHIRSPKSISITTQPNKLEYITGEELDLTGMVVQVLYNDNSTRAVTDYTVSGFDSSVEGEYTVTVKWVSAAKSTYSTLFKVTIIDPAPELTGIEVTKLPDKITYAKREGFDPTGMVISGLYSDGSKAEVTGYKVTGYNALKTGTQTLTVAYEGFTAQFTVTVGASCTHSATEIRNASIATCTTPGYSGDTYCTSCNALVSSGQEIPAVLQDCFVSDDMLSGLTPGISKDEFIGAYFNSDSSEIEFASPVVGTGTVVTITHSDGSSEAFEILIYGDLNGDGWYDGTDAVLVKCLIDGMLTEDDVSEAVYMAADCNCDGYIDGWDIEMLEKAGLLLSAIDQSKPAEVLLETSSEYVEYISLIDQSPELEIEEDAPEADAEETPEQDVNEETDFFEMILNFIRAIIEMILSRIPVPYK